MRKNFYAIVRSGYREYKITPGKSIRYAALEAGPGEPVEFNKIVKVVVGDYVITGDPCIEGAYVRGTIEGHEREQATIIFRLKRRMLYHRKSKHRLCFTRIKIHEIAVGDTVFKQNDADPRKIKRMQAASRKAKHTTDHQRKDRLTTTPTAMNTGTAFLAETVSTSAQASAPTPAQAQTQTRVPVQPSVQVREHVQAPVQTPVQMPESASTLQHRLRTSAPADTVSGPATVSMPGAESAPEPTADTTSLPDSTAIPDAVVAVTKPATAPRSKTLTEPATRLTTPAPLAESTSESMTDRSKIASLPPVQLREVTPQSDAEVQHSQNSNHSRKLLLLVATLAGFGVLVMLLLHVQEPAATNAPIEISKLDPADIPLRTTHSVDSPNSPMQPPD